MPCLNEELTLPICIGKAMKAFEELGIWGEVVVADNGSTDRSVAIAESLGARVVHQPVKGYGAAIQAGILGSRGEIIIMGDSDDSYDWSDIGRFVTKIREGYDLVMGNRFRGGIEPGAMPSLHRYLGNPVLSFISRIAFRVPIGDFHCGMRAFTRDGFRRMQPRTSGMEFATEMIAAAAGCELRISEIPIKLHKDKRDRPPHLRSFRDGWRHLKFIVSYAPDHLFLFPGIGLLTGGFLLQLALADGPLRFGRIYLGIHFLALAVGASLMGFNVMAMGVLAKVVVGRRFPASLGSGTLKFIRIFTVERGLIIGGCLFLIGFLGALLLLMAWLGHPGRPMERTVHAAFVAINLMVLGVNVLFSSFLVHLVLSENRMD
jgi:glycosyltransferase involved in cell wall biosynthesis